MAQPECPRCGHIMMTNYPLCRGCEHELGIRIIEEVGLEQHFNCNYSRRLSAGFAILRANNDPTGYDRLWS